MCVSTWIEKTIIGIFPPTTSILILLFSQNNEQGKPCPLQNVHVRHRNRYRKPKCLPLVGKTHKTRNEGQQNDRQIITEPHENKKTIITRNCPECIEMIVTQKSKIKCPFAIFQSHNPIL